MKEFEKVYEEEQANRLPLLTKDVAKLFWKRALEMVMMEAGKPESNNELYTFENVFKTVQEELNG